MNWSQSFIGALKLSLILALLVIIAIALYGIFDIAYSWSKPFGLFVVAPIIIIGILTILVHEDNNVSLD